MSHAETVADITAAIRIAPVSGRTNLHNWVYQRGEIHEAAGNIGTAIADYRKTLESDPGHNAANKALTRLRVKE